MPGNCLTFQSGSSFRFSIRNPQSQTRNRPIADCGMRVADWKSTPSNGLTFQPGSSFRFSIRNPHSEIRNREIGRLYAQIPLSRKPSTLTEIITVCN